MRNGPWSDPSQELSVARAADEIPVLDHDGSGDEDAIDPVGGTRGMVRPPDVGNRCRVEDDEVGATALRDTADVP